MNILETVLVYFMYSILVSSHREGFSITADHSVMVVLLAEVPFESLQLHKVKLCPAQFSSLYFTLHYKLLANNR